MRLLQRFGGVLLIALVAILIAEFQIVSAQISEQVEVSATVPDFPPFETPDTIVIFQGIAYPASTLTISQNGTVVSSITTTAQASFSVSIIVDPGNHTFSIWGVDADEVVGKVSNFTLTLADGSTTTISGIFLGPSIVADRTTMTAGETITLSGTTLPNGDVNVTLTTVVSAGAAAGAAGLASAAGLVSAGLLGAALGPAPPHAARSEATVTPPSPRTETRRNCRRLCAIATNPPEV